MATLAPVPAPPATHRKWNTLEILTRSRTALFALTALLAIAIISATHVHYETMKLVGQDTVPSIIQAQKIKTALADMDADAADDLLNPLSTRSAGLYDKRRIEAATALVEAAKNVTFGDAEQQPIDTLEVVMGIYERLIQQARDLQDGGQQDMAVRYYRAAAIVMDGTLLPAADALDKANTDVLTQEYESRSTSSLLARLGLLLAGIIALGALVAAQLYLMRRTRRTLNPALAAATLIALSLTLYCFVAMSREQSDLDTAKRDAFTSVHALLQARAVAYSANADESRFLLDPAHAADYQHSFEQKTSLLLHPPRGLDDKQLLAQLNAGETAPGLTGYLADEYHNVTVSFAGERESAIESVADYQQYLAIDKQLRVLETSGQHDRAVALDVGRQENESDWAFARFDDALGRTLDINQTQYDTLKNRGFDAIARLDWIGGITCLFIAVLIFLGFAPRIREYQ